MMEKIVVDEKYNGKKLNKIVLDKISEINYNIFCKILRKKDIKVNGKRTNKDILVYSKDIIEIYLPNSEKKLNIEIIYEDENILVINKKANIEVVGEKSLTTQTIEILLNKFKKKKKKKHYLALVYGIPKEKHKVLEDYLFKDNKKSQVYISNSYKKGYQKIITIYKVLEERKDNTSLLDVEIKTGKTHQIRAHLAYIGYPIIGDGKYGKNEINKKFHKKYQCLQSNELKFNFTTPSGILDYLNGKSIKI